MVVTNPCETASFTTFYPTNSLTYSVATDSVGMQYVRATDSVGDAFGNDYTKCGDRLHYIQEKITGGRVYTQNGDFSDSTFQSDLAYPFIEFLYYSGGDPTDSSATTPVF